MEIKNGEHNVFIRANIGDTGEIGFSPTLLTFGAIATFMIMIVGIFGNFLTVVALLRCPKVRNVAAAFIISLGVADLLFCALVLPFNAMRFIQGTWTHGEFLCKLIPFVQYGNVGVSLLCIALITINRYIMIAHHNSYGKIYKRHWIAIMIIFCWSFSYGMQLPTLLGVWGTFGYDSKLGTCSIMTDVNGKSSKTTLFIIAFIIPCLIIIACYTKIFWVVHKSEMRLKEHAKKQNSIPNNLRVTPTQSATDNGVVDTERVATDSSYSAGADKQPSRVKDQREVRTKRNEWRITKMVLAIFLSFLVCYLPITIVKVADKDVHHPSMHVFSYIMLYLSACINPIIYVIMNKQYRKAFKTIIMCKPSRLLLFGNASGNGNGAVRGSSVPEKWKDAGYHSRTMVSQMSLPDQSNPKSSFSSSQSQPITLEMIAISSPKLTIEALADQESSSQYLKSSNIINSNQSSSKSLKRRCPNSNVSAITHLGDDIIIEEMESPTQMTPAADYLHLPIAETSSEAALDRKQPIDACPSLRKSPYYGGNMNAIPDNSIKLSSKLRI